MTTLTASQMKAVPENCEDARLLLYEAIRDRISQSFFSRIKIDEEELLHVIFMELCDKVLPEFGSDEMTELLDRQIKDTIRAFKRAGKPARPTTDIDDADPDEGPSYDERLNSEEVEFEKTFERFCNSFDEPKRSVYLRSRTHTKKQLARINGISEKMIYKMFKEMAHDFELFLKKFRE